MPKRLILRGKDAQNLVGPRLRELREAAGIRHVQMIEALQDVGWEISPSALTRIENGERNLMDLEIFEMLKVLGKSWSALDASITSPLKDSKNLNSDAHKKMKRNSA